MHLGRFRLLSKGCHAQKPAAGCVFPGVPGVSRWTDSAELTRGARCIFPPSAGDAACFVYAAHAHARHRLSARGHLPEAEESRRWLPSTTTTSTGGSRYTSSTMTYSAPLLPAGTMLHAITVHDNTTANPRNPDPTRWVGYGQASIEEMAGSFISWLYPGRRRVPPPGRGSGPHDSERAVAAAVNSRNATSKRRLRSRLHRVLLAGIVLGLSYNGLSAQRKVQRSTGQNVAPVYDGYEANRDGTYWMWLISTGIMRSPWRSPSVRTIVSSLAWWIEVSQRTSCRSGRSPHSG